MIYLDHNATTPVHPKVMRAMQPFFSDRFGNSSSAHAFGKVPKEKKEEARGSVAALLGCGPGEVVFTSGGTESDNTAIKGAVFAAGNNGAHVVTTAVEHPAVLHTCRYLEERFGCRVTYLPVDGFGRVEPARVAEAITPATVLVTVMMANNETGTLNDIAGVGRVAREKGVLFHTDAVQAVGKVPISVDDLQVDLLSVSGHKIYGPKGTGVLYVRQGVKIDPYLQGGAHEGGRRAGTENIPGIVGLGMAARLAGGGIDERAARLTEVRDYLWERIEAEVPEVKLNGHPGERLPNTVNVSFPRIEGESAMMMLDTRGIALSTGSACSSEDLEPSHVLTAMGVESLDARGALRFSLGRDGERGEVDAVMDVLPEIIARLRAMSPL